MVENNTAGDAQVLRDPPIAGSEIDTLIGSLERGRRLFAWKAGGLDADDMAKTLGPSTMTLGGLVKHLALVEDDHFNRLLLGKSDGPPPPWDKIDWDADPDWEWHSAAEDSPEDLWALWHAAVARSRALVAGALANGDAGQLGAYKTRSGESPALRRILIDMVEEYARHVGHADLIRESIDGLVGEDTD